MSFLDRLGAAKAAGATFALNFWPWLLGAFLIGAGVAGWSGFKVAKLIYQGDALEAQVQLSNFEKSLAQSSAMGEAEASRRQDEALAAMRARDQLINARVGEIPAQVAAMLGPKFTALRESINDPKYDCLRIPYPPAGLRLLERPGGRAAENRGSGEASADPGRLPDTAVPRTP